MPAARLFLTLFLAAALSAGARASPLRKPPFARVPTPSGEEDRAQAWFMQLGHFFDNEAQDTAARPDGSGSAYNLYRLFLQDVTRDNGLAGDFTFLSDRKASRRWPISQMDYRLGLATRAGRFKLQFNREEFLPLDRKGPSYRYWDARLILPVGDAQPSRRREIAQSIYVNGDIPFARLEGAVSFGYFLHNKSFAARKDLSGLAFLRYGGKLEYHLFQELMSFFAEAEALTDKGHSKFFPVGMDYSLGVGAALYGWDVTLSQECRRNLDRSGKDAAYLLAITKAVKMPF